MALGYKPGMPPVHVVIVSPSLAEANSGNWRTAERWRRLLQASGLRARVSDHWPDAAADRDAVMLALHARKSAPAIAAWHARHGTRGLGVVLTGTDLYPDIAQDPVALQSLALARSLVVLHTQAQADLPRAHRGKARVILQSSPPRVHRPRSHRRLQVLVVGHLREEKNPALLWQAVQALAPEEGLAFTHIGRALAPHWAAQAQTLAQTHPHYRWLGDVPHSATLRQLQSAHLLVHPSRQEGGPLVLTEALACGTPVLATRIAGHVGLLGADYGGLVPNDDAPALVAALRRVRASQGSPQGLLAQWAAQCAAMRARLDPAHEQAALQAWVQDLLAA